MALNVDPSQPTADDLREARAYLAAFGAHTRAAAVAGYLSGVIEGLAHTSPASQAPRTIAGARAMFQALQDLYVPRTEADR